MVHKWQTHNGGVPSIKSCRFSVSRHLRITCRVMISKSQSSTRIGKRSMVHKWQTLNGSAGICGACGRRECMTQRSSSMCNETIWLLSVGRSCWTCTGHVFVENANRRLNSQNCGSLTTLFNRFTWFSLVSTVVLERQSMPVLAVFCESCKML